jgi:murein DD-endopeptidase MepM/ murein hydrolase activator NlpD
MLSTNTANFTDMMSYSGLTGEALDRLQTSMTVGQAAVTSAFNADTNNAVYTLLSDIMMNPNSSNLYKVGSQTEAIRGSLMAGDYGSALQALLNSDYYKELANRDINSQTWMNLSAEDKMIANMVRNQNKLDMSEYNKVMGMSSSDAKKYLDEMQKAQADSLTWQEKVSNWFSLKFGKLDWVVFTSLGTIAFGLYITSKVFELVPKAFKFLFGTGGVLRGAGSITNSVGAIKAFASGTASFASAALPVITTIGVAIAGLAAAFLAYRSFAKDWKDAEANGSSGIAGAIFGTRKGLENVISNGFKFLLVGIAAAAVAILAGAPLAVAAGIVAGLAALGALLGAIGNLLGIGKKKADVGGVDNVGGTALAGVGGVSSPVVGGKAAIKPWGISSRFGPRSYKYKGKMVHDNHKGIDLTSKSGTPLGANAAGYVVAKGSGWSGGRGNYVAIEDAKGWRHTYMHMIQPTNLKKGDYVNEAQIVGYMGSTGRSTGTHLHYQINKGSKAIDPEPYLTSNLVRASAFGKTNKSLLPSVSNKKDAEEKDNILSKFISEDTRQKDLVASQYANYFATETGVGGPESSGITGTVKTGFGDLLNKLDELSAKQEDQERVLSALTGRMGTSLFKY